MSDQSQSYFVRQDYENMISSYIINDYRAVSKRSQSTILQMRSLIIDFYRFTVFMVVGPAIVSNLTLILSKSTRSAITVAVASVIIGLVSVIYTNKPKTINIYITEYNTVEVTGYTLDIHNKRLKRAFEGLSTLIVASLLIYTALIVRHSIMH